MKTILPNNRYYGLDAARIIATFFVVLFHSTNFYGSLGTIYPDTPMPSFVSNNFLLGIYGLFFNAFCMQLFFLISGFAAVILYEQRGFFHFISNRTQRIVIPFIVTLILLIPLLKVIFEMAFVGIDPLRALWNGGAQSSLVKERFLTTIHPQHFLSEIQLGPLWYIWYLVGFTVLFVFLKRVTNFIVLNDSVQKGLCWLWNSPLKVMLFAIPSAMFKGFMLGSVGIDTHGFDPTSGVFCFHWHLLAYYGFFFLAGVALYGHYDRLVSNAKSWKYYLLLALATMTLYYISLDGVLASFFPKLVKDFIYSVSTWSTILFILGFCNCYFSKKSKWWSYLSDSSYWVYLVHMLPAYYFSVFFKDWDVSIFTKSILVLTLTLVVSLVSYHYCARYTFIGSFLHRKRVATNNKV